MMPDTPKKKSLQLIIHLLGWGYRIRGFLFIFFRKELDRRLHRSLSAIYLRTGIIDDHFLFQLLLSDR